MVVVVGEMVAVLCARKERIAGGVVGASVAMMETREVKNAEQNSLSDFWDTDVPARAARERRILALCMVLLLAQSWDSWM